MREMTGFLAKNSLLARAQNLNIPETIEDREGVAMQKYQRSNVIQ